MHIPIISDRPVLWSRVLGTLAFVTCVLVGVNMYLFTGNQGLQREVAERQQLMTQNAQLQPLSREIVTALANLATKNNDEQLKQLLTSHGISFYVSQPSALEGRGK